MTGGDKPVITAGYKGPSDERTPGTGGGRALLKIDEREYTTREDPIEEWLPLVQPGPWELRLDGNFWAGRIVRADTGETLFLIESVCPEDVRFVCQARELVPRLLAERRALRLVLDGIRTEAACVLAVGYERPEQVETHLQGIFQRIGETLAEDAP